MNRNSSDLLGPKSDAVRGAQLLLQTKNRRIHRKFLAEGPAAVSAAIAAGLVESIYAIPSAESLIAEYSGRVYWVTEAGLKTIAETETPQGLVAVCRQPEVDIEQLAPKRILACHEIADPGNLGTMIRTAAAAGYDLVVTTSGSVDVWSGKVVRSTAGMFGIIPIYAAMDTSDLLSYAQTSNLASIATTGAAELFTTSKSARELLSQPHVLWIGNEAHGLPDLVLHNSIGTRIPMVAGVESLNAAVAAAICMYATQFDA